MVLYVCPRKHPIVNFNKFVKILQFLAEQRPTSSNNNSTHSDMSGVVATTSQPDAGYIVAVVIGSVLTSALILGAVSVSRTLFQQILLYLF